jgi:prolipoprotein diacylglyceryltransferase
MRLQPRSAGSIFWWYLILAPSARFVIEFVRINKPVLFGLTAAQLFSAALVVVGAWQLAQVQRHASARAPAVGKS